LAMSNPMFWVMTIFVYSVAAQAGPGTCKVQVSGSSYDLSSLAGQEFQVPSSFYPETYTFFPCSNGCLGPENTPASICQNNNNGDPIAPVTIFDSTMTWSAYNNSISGMTGIQYTTANGAPPLCSPSNKPRFATVIFVCTSGTPNFTISNEPGLQGCAVNPGYVFQLTTPLACPGYVPPPPGECPYQLASPCIIQTFNQYAWANGWSLDFNQDGDACGKIFFSDYLITKQPADTCANTTGTGFRLIAHMDILAFPKIVQMLQDATAQNPIEFFWDNDANSASIGPSMPAP